MEIPNEKKSKCPQCMKKMRWVPIHKSYSKEDKIDKRLGTSQTQDGILLVCDDCVQAYRLSYIDKDEKLRISIFGE